MTKTIAGTAQVDHFVQPAPRRAGALALIQSEEDGRFLVVRRGYRDGDAAWGLPGGSAAPNELPRDALARTLAEKLDLRVTGPSSRGAVGRWLASDHVPAAPGQFEGRNDVFHVSVWNRQFTLSGGYVDSEWVNVLEAQALLGGYSLRRFEESVYALKNGTVRELVHGRKVEHAR